jgi:hypothetical protein
MKYKLVMQKKFKRKNKMKKGLVRSVDKKRLVVHRGAALKQARGGEN